MKRFVGKMVIERPHGSLPAALDRSAVSMLRCTVSFGLAVSIIVTAFFGLSGVAQSAAAASPTTVLGIKGKCESVLLAGIESKCARGSGVVFMVLPNGRAIFSFALEDGRVASFVGEKDSQPRPEDYHLYLSRFRITAKGSEFVANIAGECVVSMSQDGKIWWRIDCNGTDAKNATYKLNFKSDGTPVNTGDHVEVNVVRQVTQRFKSVLNARGMQGVVTDLEQCFDNAIDDISAIKMCMLYDISAVKFDKIMRLMFESRGVNTGPTTPFLSDRAFSARMKIYSSIAFGGSEELAYDYFGDSPNKVMDGVSR